MDSSTEGRIYYFSIGLDFHLQGFVGSQGTRNCWFLWSFLLWTGLYFSQASLLQDIFISMCLMTSLNVLVCDDMSQLEWESNIVCVSTSAGVGRTGVFITLSIVLERMRYEGVVDLFQTVKTLRTQRPAMVQTEVGHTVCTAGSQASQHLIFTLLLGSHRTLSFYIDPCKE